MAASQEIGNTDSNARKIYSYLKNKGCNDILIAAILGNWDSESGIDPSGVEGIYNEPFSVSGPKKSSALRNMNSYCLNKLFPNYAGRVKINKPGYLSNGKYYPGLGLGQYTGPAAEKILNVASANHQYWYNIDFQIDYAFSGNYRPGFLDRFKKDSQSSKSIDFATRYFCKNWEGVTYALAKRQSRAKIWLNKIKTFTYDPNVAQNIVNTNSATSGITETVVIGDPKDTINADKINAFLLLVERNITNLNYPKLTSNHISGVVFESGYLYNTAHLEVSYRNPNIATQVKSAKDAKFKYGLYHIVRARNVQEAEKECEALYFTINKYPPSIGLWLKLELTQSKTTNGRILDIYKEKTSRWGLNNFTGIYCEKSQLDMIDWEKYKDKFYLWYINRFTDSSGFNQVHNLITPSFFKV